MSYDISSNPRFKNPKIVRSPNGLVVYKIGKLDDQHFFSLALKTLYVLGYLYKLYKPISPFLSDRVNNTYSIKEGFHSYTCQAASKIFDVRIKKRVKIIEWVGFGKHTLEIDLCVVKCLIPQGSQYYYNPEKKEYLSNQIIIQELFLPSLAEFKPIVRYVKL